MKEYRLYWSSLELYEECPQKFLWRRGWQTIDLGAGLGRPKPLDDAQRGSEHHLLMGSVLADVIEMLYTKEWWREPSLIKSKLDDFTVEEFERQLTKRYIDWDRSPSKKELLEACLTGVRNYLIIMKRNRLLGDIYSKAERWLRAEVEGVPIGGRPDLTLKSSISGVSIIDGKNSKSPGRYTKKDQLRWYALLHYIIYGELASNLAFAYFRYPPSGPPESHLKKKKKTEWTGMVHVDVTMDHLEDLAQRAKKVHQGMLGESFEAVPSSKACRFCDYKDFCVSYKEDKLSKFKESEFSGKGFITLSL